MTPQPAGNSVRLRDIFFNMAKKIEQKQIESGHDLAKERMAYAPILGKDSFVAVVWYAIIKLLSTDILTQSGVWVIVSTWLGYRLAIKSFELPGGPSENLKWLLYGFGAHSVLAWLWWCARDQARNLLSAAADWIRGKTKPAAPTGGVAQ